MSQRDRVLAALYRRGRHGLTQIDFDLPDVIDGGAPIKRVAARVEELRDQGFRITSGERRNKCTVYRVEGVTSDAGTLEEPVPATDTDGAPTLFAPQKPRNAIFDEAA
jgi:hypothetical protein